MDACPNMPADVYSCDCNYCIRVRQCPLLHPLLTSGKVYWSDSEQNYIGIASDGKEVLLGNDPESVENYLQVHPTPENW